MNYTFDLQRVSAEFMKGCVKTELEGKLLAYQMKGFICFQIVNWCVLNWHGKFWELCKRSHGIGLLGKWESLLRDFARMQSMGLVTDQKNHSAFYGHRK